VSARSWTRPASSLPALHAFELCCIVELDDAVDLAIRVLVVLAGVFLLAVHPDGGDAQVLGVVVGQGDLGATIFGTGGIVSVRRRGWRSLGDGPVHLDGGYPSFILFDCSADVRAEILVVFVAWAIVLVQVRLELMPRSSLQIVELSSGRSSSRRLLTGSEPR
jgi:hypothetical protein